MALASYIAKTLTSCITNGTRASIALSGGSSPIALYEELSKQAVDWHRVTVTLIDDRKVPANHRDSNQLLVRETLLQGRAANAKFISLEEWPVNQSPDIGILGMGVDGHIASLFKDNVNKKNKKIVDFVKRKDFSRVTLTLKCLNSSKNIFLWAPGKGKSNIVKKIISDKKLSYPASFLKVKNNFLFYSN